MAGDGPDSTVWVRELIGVDVRTRWYSVAEVTALICEHAYPRITRAEWDQYFTGLPCP